MAAEELQATAIHGPPEMAHDEHAGHAQHADHGGHGGGQHEPGTAHGGHGAGTAVARASADIVLIENDPRDVAWIITLSRATYRKMVQNLAWAVEYNVIALPWPRVPWQALGWYWRPGSAAS